MSISRRHEFQLASDWLVVHRKHESYHHHYIARKTVYITSLDTRAGESVDGVVAGLEGLIIVGFLRGLEVTLLGVSGAPVKTHTNSSNSICINTLLASSFIHSLCRS